MSYVVSARKYRPARFDEVVGQQHVSQTLKKAFQTDHLAHAFLFCGPRGVGKTTCARILAKVLNCQNVSDDLEPCGTCDSCKAFNENASFNIMELDAASNNSVEHIRTLVEQVRFQPQQGKYKIFIIDEVHMLSQAAFNAFLKTLEEPPPYAIFILATTEKHKIIPTILSRCQIFDFKRIQIKDIVGHLAKICKDEGIQAEAEALHIIAQKADGALRDALSIFDRIVSFAGNKITYEDVITNLNVLDYDYYFRFTDALLTSDLRQVLLIFDEVLRNGFEGDLFVNGLAAHLRNLLVCQDKETARLLDASDSLRERYHQQATVAPAPFILTALNLANDCDVNYKMARDKKLHVELALIKMCHITQAVQLASYAQPAIAEKKTAEPSIASPPKGKPDLTAQESNPEVVSGPSTSEEVATPNAFADGEKEVATETTEEVVKGDLPEEISTEKITEEPQAAESAANEPGPEPEIETPILAEPEVPAANLPEPETAPEEGAETPPKQKAEPKANGLRKGKNGVLPTLQSLDSLHAEVEEAEANRDKTVADMVTEDDLRAAWSAYVEATEKDSVRAILKGAEISVEGKEVTAVVGSALAESLIRQERGLMEFLREKLRSPMLSMRIKLDPSRSNAAPAKPKALTVSQKYWQMKTINPLVDDVRKRFDLKLENE